MLTWHGKWRLTVNHPLPPLIQMQHNLCHHGDAICHPNSSYLTTKLYETSACGCNNNLRSFSKSYFHVSYRRRMLGTLAKQRSRLGDACQSSEMVTLLNSLSFVFKISFLPTYCVKYYDYIVKWCRGTACHWCASLDIALIWTQHNFKCRLDSSVNYITKRIKS